MMQLGELDPVPRVDKKYIREFFPKESKQHSGRMKVELACNILDYFLSDSETKVVLDPMMGVGTTAVACLLQNCGPFVGCDMVPEWVECARRACERVREREVLNLLLRRKPWESFHFLAQRSELVDLSDYMNQPADLLLTSPPFPNAHTQGDSEMQKKFLDHKKTYAGNEFEEQNLWTTEGKFKTTLSKVLDHWVSHLRKDAPCLVHIKNYVRDKEEVRVDLWVAESLSNMTLLEVEGYLSVPLPYGSMFRNLHKYHLREITSYEVVEPKHSVRMLGTDKSVETIGQKSRKDYLECGHVKHRDHDPGPATKKARCTECPPIEGVPEITEERIVVARKK